MPIAIETWRDLRLRRFMLYDESYVAIGYDEPWSGAIRLALLLFAMLLSVAFLVLMPRRATGSRRSARRRCTSTCCTRSCCSRSARPGCSRARSRSGCCPAMIVFCIGDLGRAVAEARAAGVPAARRAAGAVAVPARAVDRDRHARAAARRDAAAAQPSARPRVAASDDRRAESARGAKPEPDPSRADAASPRPALRRVSGSVARGGTAS